jgi:hypothetical protein
MFAQWWGSVQIQSAIFVQRLVTWDSEAFQSPTTAQTQTLAGIVKNDINNITNDKIRNHNCRKGRG